MFPVWRVGILTTAFFVAACSGSSSYCPGLCAVDSTHPVMTIEVAGGTAVIAKAEVTGGPCSKLLVQSSGEAGAPSAYAAVRVTYNGPTQGPLPLCLVRVTFIDGQQADFNAEAKVGIFQQSCCPRGTCCAKEQAVTVHQAVTFVPAVQTVVFAPLDSGVLDGSADGAGNDVPIPQDADLLDGAKLDSAGPLDAPDKVDGELVDASLDASLVDAAVDVAVGI